MMSVTHLSFVPGFVVGLTMEFTEIIWKATVKLAFPDKQDYMEFMGYYSTAVCYVCSGIMDDSFVRGEIWSYN